MFWWDTNQLGVYSLDPQSEDYQRLSSEYERINQPTINKSIALDTARLGLGVPWDTGPCFAWRGNARGRTLDELEPATLRTSVVGLSLKPLRIVATISFVPA